MKIRVIIATMVALMLFPVFCMAGGVVVISNPTVPASALSKEDVSSIFIGRKVTWNDGSKIIFATLKDPATHETFLKEYIGKTVSQFANHWKKQVFTGKGSSPQVLDGNEEMIKFVSETKGAIGYVSSNPGVTTVKTITVK